MLLSTSIESRIIECTNIFDDWLERAMLGCGKLFHKLLPWQYELMFWVEFGVEEVREVDRNIRWD